MCRLPQRFKNDVVPLLVWVNAVLAELERFAKNRQILFLAHPLPGEPEARKLP